MTHTHGLLRLPMIHGDPFDRTLAAHSLVEKVALVSGDKVFRQYPIEVIW